MAAYNLGNALYEEGRYDEAVRAYTRSLMDSPDDMDAKRNLELALRALEEQQQQKDQQPQPDGEQGEQDEQQQQESAPSEGDEEQEQPQTQPDASEDEPPGEEQPRPQPREEPGAMNPQEAERLLDSLDEEEREAQRRRMMREAHVDTRTAEEDW